MSVLSVPSFISAVSSGESAHKETYLFQTFAPALHSSPDEISPLRRPLLEHICNSSCVAKGSWKHLAISILLVAPQVNEWYLCCVISGMSEVSPLLCCRIVLPCFTNCSLGSNSFGLLRDFWDGLDRDLAHLVQLELLMRYRTELSRRLRPYLSHDGIDSPSEPHVLRHVP